MNEEAIKEEAKRMSLLNVTKFAPHSYRQGFTDGAVWALQHINELQTTT
jgi:hypothetical protein